MATEPKVMQELHVIRVKLYEKTKHMTPEERAAFINKRAEEQAEKYGVTLKRPSHKAEKVAERSES